MHAVQTLNGIHTIQRVNDKNQILKETIWYKEIKTMVSFTSFEWEVYKVCCTYPVICHDITRIEQCYLLRLWFLEHVISGALNQINLG